MEAKNTPINHGEKFMLLHALQCSTGGYTKMRHNEIQDPFAEIKQDVCYVVEFEPAFSCFKASSLYKKLLPLMRKRGWLLKRMAYWGPGSAFVSSA